MTKPILIRFKPPGSTGRPFVIFAGWARFEQARLNQRHAVDAIDLATNRRYVIDPITDHVSFCREGIHWQPLTPPFAHVSDLFHCAGQPDCRAALCWRDADRNLFYCQRHALRKEQSRSP